MKYKINDLAKLLHVTTMTLRRYEKYGYITPERNTSDYRTYHTSDISRIAQIRLLRRCGFTHEEITKTLGSSYERINEITHAHLDSLDAEIKRLGNLRHWLKDNIVMMEVLQDLKDNFTIMNCPPMYYVLYSEGDRILQEKERHKTIADMITQSEEIQLIHLYDNEEVAKGIYLPRRGWAVKEMDVMRYKLDGIISNSEYVLHYPCVKCLYGAIFIPSEHMNDNEKRNEYIIDFAAKKDLYMKENGLSHSGDVVAFLVDTLGEINSVMVCMPVSDAK